MVLVVRSGDGGDGGDCGGGGDGGGCGGGGGGGGGCGGDDDDVDDDDWILFIPTVRRHNHVHFFVVQNMMYTSAFLYPMTEYRSRSRQPCQHVASTN